MLFDSIFPELLIGPDFEGFIKKLFLKLTVLTARFDTNLTFGLV
jgi:hypothetical protein